MTRMVVVICFDWNGKHTVVCIRSKHLCQQSKTQSETVKSYYCDVFWIFCSVLFDFTLFEFSINLSFSPTTLSLCYFFRPSSVLIATSFRWLRYCFVLMTTNSFFLRFNLVDFLLISKQASKQPIICICLALLLNIFEKRAVEWMFCFCFRVFVWRITKSSIDLY